MPWTVDDCTAALRTAAPADGSPLLHQDYEAWRRARTGYPSALTVVRLWGTWADALEAAGALGPEGLPAARPS